MAYNDEAEMKTTLLEGCKNKQWRGKRHFKTRTASCA
jgi:hypothetical protein